MSMHKKPLTKLEHDGLLAHGLDIGTPSQLSDVFRQGIEFTLANAHTVQREGWVSVPIEEMVNRFLGWKLPSDFSPDCGIEFDANKYPNHKFEPIGTNLFTANQAKEMIEHMLSAAPTDTE